MIAHTEAISLEQIENAIFLIRGLRVMLSTDLAALYGGEISHTEPSG
jgi:hypothetical protein